MKINDNQSDLAMEHKHKSIDFLCFSMEGRKPIKICKINNADFTQKQYKFRKFGIFIVFTRSPKSLIQQEKTMENEHSFKNILKRDGSIYT